MNYKGDKAGYAAIHRWLRTKYGHIKICENKKCPKLCKFFDWALKHGKRHKRRKNNYLRLCHSCHLKYDMTKRRKEKISQALKGRKISNGNTGMKQSKETRLKISKSLKLHYGKS